MFDSQKIAFENFVMRLQEPEFTSSAQILVQSVEITREMLNG
jgi:hypothetical protein